MRAAVAVLALVGLVACEPCHRQHRRVTFSAAHYADKWGVPCIPILQDGCHRVPDRCIPSLVCSEECRAIDAGQLEAHAKHEPISDPAVVDVECQ